MQLKYLRIIFSRNVSMSSLPGIRRQRCLSDYEKQTFNWSQCTNMYRIYIQFPFLKQNWCTLNTYNAHVHWTCTLYSTNTCKHALYTCTCILYMYTWRLDGESKCIVHACTMCMHTVVCELHMYHTFIMEENVSLFASVAASFLSSSSLSLSRKSIALSYKYMYMSTSQSH